MKKMIVVLCIVLGLSGRARASGLEDLLYQTSLPYIKYFVEQPEAPGFSGLRRSFLLPVGYNNPADLVNINYGASGYDQTILGRILLMNNNTSIIDTYVQYARLLNDPDNPLVNTNGDYYDADHNPLLYGPYRVARILGRSEPHWWETWDWLVDTGAASCWVIYALDAYRLKGTVAYRELAELLAGYILKLQDTDGGIRYGPRGMYDAPGSQPDSYWNLKSTEQNERCLAAFEALYTITNNAQYLDAANRIKGWLKSMYDLPVHLYHSSATFDGASWQKADFGYVATDVVAFAPLEMMFSDAYFGVTQDQRDFEVDAMFAAIESRTAFLNGQNQPVFFRFSVSQVPDPTRGDYGSVEFSSQMAIAYLRAAQEYAVRNTTKSQEYLNKYNTLVDSLGQFFATVPADPNAKIAPYASYYTDRSVAGGVPTGTGYYTYSCQAALASAYFAFSKAGYDPGKLGGGPGIPSVNCVINIEDMAWYQNTAPYNSTGAASAQMVLNYIRQGANVTLLTQNQVYEYGKTGTVPSGELTATEVDKALGHFDPYDSLVSNSFDTYDTVADGNPFQGYNFGVDAYDPAINANAQQEYMRDICHWIAYPVTQGEWWLAGPAVARPNTPALIPLFGDYTHWVVVKGFAASANPIPQPYTNPWYSPDFTVYGYWINDPLIDGIGQDTYKTAAECASTYFRPLASSSDQYKGRYLQVAEPPPISSRAQVTIAQPSQGVAAKTLVSSGALAAASAPNVKIRGVSWRDLVDKHLASDPAAAAAFTGTRLERPIFVKRPDRVNADYYLIPCNKYVRGKGMLTAGVILSDAKRGYFKEATWTKTPEQFLKVDKQRAFRLIRARLISAWWQASLRRDYSRAQRIANLIGQLPKADAELIWQPGRYSTSAFKPYWRIRVGGYLWYATQENRVYSTFSY